MLQEMTTPLWPPAATVTPAELLAGLTATERLLGYEAIVDRILDDLGATATTACLRATRPDDDGGSPSVLVVLDDVLVEYWLSGTVVERADVPRPGRQT
jgi:hypothetical protein